MIITLNGSPAIDVAMKCRYMENVLDLELIPQNESSYKKHFISFYDVG